MNWLNQIQKDLSNIPAFVDFYEQELEQAKKESSLHGKMTLEKHSAELPGVVALRFTQLQEIEAVLEYMNIVYRKKRSEVFKKFLESYNRALSSRDAEKYVDGDADVVAYALLINEVALIRNKYLAIHKGLETKQWQIGHIIKLRCAGLEDASL